ncbi:hypothetical protein P0947_16465, partial [Xanthomonas hortorum pv. gardneri]
MLLSPTQGQAGMAQRQLPCIRGSGENVANVPDGTVWLKGRDLKASASSTQPMLHQVASLKVTLCAPPWRI